MKKSDFKLMIRKIVREEVAMAIHEVINELKQPTKSVSKPIVEKKKIVKKREYSKNSVLNDLLNETANDDNWRTMGKDTYTSNDVHSIVGSSYGDMMNNTRQVNPDQMVATMGVNPDTVSDELKDTLFNKDYSTLIKKSIEKSNQRKGA